MPGVHVDQTQLHREIGGVTGGAGWEAEEDRDVSGRCDVGKPVDAFVEGQLFQLAAVGPDPSQLRMTGLRGELLGVEHDPGSVGRPLAAVGRSRMGGDGDVVPSVGVDGVDRGRGPPVVTIRFQSDVAEATSVRADAVQEVQGAVPAGDPVGGAAGERDGPDVPVVGGGVDGDAVGREDVVVVDAGRPSALIASGSAEPSTGRVHSSPSPLMTSWPSSVQLGASKSRLEDSWMVCTSAEARFQIRTRHADLPGAGVGAPDHRTPPTLDSTREPTACRWRRRPSTARS